MISKRIKEILFSINFKTVYFNLKYLPFLQAIRFPIFIAHRTYLFRTRGRVTIHGPVYPGMIRIGFGEVGIFDNKRKRVIWEVRGDIHFYGNAILKFGSRISVGEGAELHIGSGFRISPKSTIVCGKKVIIGNNVRVSWDTIIIDTDFHKIKNSSGEIMNHPKEIKIGNNVWIGMRSTIMKGTTIENDVVVGAGSFLNRPIKGSKQIIAGRPAKVVKEDVTWEP